MKLNDLLVSNSLDPRSVLVLRHRPKEPELKKILPWLAGERHELFNAYQQSQYEKLERVMNSLSGNGHLASFIGHEPGRALFVGLYRIAGAKPINYRDYWNISANMELKRLGMSGWNREESRETVLWLELKPTDV